MAKRRRQNQSEWGRGASRGARAGGAPASRQALVAGVLGAAAVLGAIGLTIWRSHQPATPPVPPVAAETKGAAPQSPPGRPPLREPPGRSGTPAGPAPQAGAPRGRPDDPARVLARVGTQKITQGDVARYQKFKRLSFGFSSERRALSELADRTLLTLAAAEKGIVVGEAELALEISRRKLWVSALTPSTAGTGGMFGSPMGGLGGGGIGGPRGFGLAGGGLGGAPSPDPFGFTRPGTPGAGPGQRVGGFGLAGDRVDRTIGDAGLTDEEFTAEVKAEALAAKAKQVLVFNHIKVSDADLAAASREHAKRTGPEPRPPGVKDTPAAARAREAGLRRTLRQRLQRERGARPLADLMTKLRAKFGVEEVAAPAPL